jgi:hypothetical protein
VRYDVFVAVWGQPFVRKFMELSLVSQLALGNLPALAKNADIHYHIYTDKASRKFFGPNLLELSEYAQIHFYYFNEIPYGDGNLEQAISNSDIMTIKHNVQRITANHMLSRLENSAAILMDSDFIIADGSLNRMHSLRRKGKRAVMTTLLRLNETTASPLLYKDIPFYLEARNLVKLCIEHMHPIFAAYFKDSQRSTNYPSQLNWWVGDANKNLNARAGVATQCLFPHPLMIEPDLLARDSGAKYFSTMDYDYALRVVADDSDIHLSRNSDEILICKISPEEYLANNDDVKPLSEKRMAQFILNNTNIRHRIFLDQLVYFVADRDGDWDVVSQEANRFIEETYKTVDTMVSRLSIADPITTVYLKSFLGPIEDFISPQLQSRMKKFFPH